MLPILFSAGGYPIRGYSMAIALGAVVGTVLFWRQTHREGRPGALALDLVAVGLLAALLGSRLLYTLLGSEGGGLVFYGAWLALPVGSLFLWLRREPLLPTWDRAVLVLPLVHAFGRVGCLFAGCCFGSPTDVSWAVVYPTTTAGAPWLPVHPVQLYEAAGLSLLSGALHVWYPRRRFPGQTLLAYAGGYAVLRFLTEFFRGDPGREGVWGWSFSQTLSLATLGVVAALLLRAGRR